MWCQRCRCEMSGVFDVRSHALSCTGCGGYLSEEPPAAVVRRSRAIGTARNILRKFSDPDFWREPPPLDSVGGSTQQGAADELAADTAGRFALPPEMVARPWPTGPYSASDGDGERELRGGRDEVGVAAGRDGGSHRSRPVAVDPPLLDDNGDEFLIEVDWEQTGGSGGWGTKNMGTPLPASIRGGQHLLELPHPQPDLNRRGRSDVDEVQAAIDENFNRRASWQAVMGRGVFWLGSAMLAAGLTMAAWGWVSDQFNLVTRGTVASIAGQIAAFMGLMMRMWPQPKAKDARSQWAGAEWLPESGRGTGRGDLPAHEASTTDAYAATNAR